MTDSQHNALFREHVTSTAFNLNLTKNMIAFLAWVASEDNPSNDELAARRKPMRSKDRDIFVTVVGRYDPVTTGSALLRRGLIWAPYPDWPGIYCLTDAGVHVFELLKLAGLVERLGLDKMGGDQ
jgi:hypothetical protein